MNSSSFQSDWDGNIIPRTSIPPLNIINIMLWMKKNAYEETTKQESLLRPKAGMTTGSREQT